MRFLRRTLLFAALLLAGCVTPLDESRWIHVESEHFRVISGASRTATVEIVQRLELLREVLKRFGLEAQLEPRVPLNVYVFPDATSFARFRPRVGYTGFMLPRADGYFLAVQGGAGSDPSVSALHEYVHFVLRNGSTTRFPAWYDEGLAEFLSTVSQQDRTAVIGTIPGIRKQWLLYGSPMSLRSVMTAQDPQEWSTQTLQRFYAQSWAVTHFFHVADRIGFPKRHAQLLEYIARLNRGEETEAAFQAAFGSDFETVEKEFMLYLAKGELPYVGISVNSLAVSKAVRTRPLPEGERRYRLGALALALGPAWRNEAEYWFRLAVQANPQSGRAQAALGRVLKNRGEADAHLKRSQELGARDAEAQRQYAEAMLARAEAVSAGADPMASLEPSRGAFRRSISLDPEQVAAYAGLGRSFLVPDSRGDPAEGLAALTTANQRLPADHSIALALAQLELVVDEVESARALLTRLPPPTHGDPVVARELVEIAEARALAGLPTQPLLSTQHMHARLDVEQPREGEIVRGVSNWVVASGHGGLWETALQDVIIAIDESPSAFLPSGADLDGDGEVGYRRSFNLLGERHSSSDPDDTVIRAELLAARALIRQLDPKTTRVGIVTFTHKAAMLAPLGPPKSALTWLDEYVPHFEAGPRTSLAAALEGALEAFFQYREDDVRRHRTVLLLSDGQPTVPTRTLGEAEALAVADRLGEIGVPVQAFALGESAIDDPEFYQELAERSGGKFIPVESPANVVNELANVRFTGLEDVTIQSSPIDQPGRAVRIFPNGAFDGYVPLAEGENLITITGVMESGETITETRTVFFERPAQPGPDDLADAAQMREDLQNRKVEIELLAEMRRAGPAQMRELTIGIEDPPDEELQMRRLKVEIKDPPDGEAADATD